MGKQPKKKVQVVEKPTGIRKKSPKKNPKTNRSTGRTTGGYSESALLRRAEKRAV